MNKIYTSKSRKVQLQITKIFILIQLLSYFTFIYFDFSNLNGNISNLIKYFTILLCLIFVLIPRKESGGSAVDHRLLKLAFLFTFISDYFLLFTEEIIPGLVTFIIVQVLYLLRIYRWKLDFNLINKSKIILPMYFLRNLFAGMILLLVLSLLSVKLELTIVLATFYFLSLLLNCFDLLRISFVIKTPQLRLFLIGLLMFLLCDINVGIFNMQQFIANPLVKYEKIYSIASVAMWIFYLPSQVFIALSKVKLNKFLKKILYNKEEECLVNSNNIC